MHPLRHIEGQDKQCTEGKRTHRDSKSHWRDRKDPAQGILEKPDNHRDSEIDVLPNIRTEPLDVDILEEESEPDQSDMDSTEEAVAPDLEDNMPGGGAGHQDSQNKGKAQRLWALTSSETAFSYENWRSNMEPKLRL